MKASAVLAAVFLAHAAEAIPVKVAWQVPLATNERYVLEVSREPGFGTAVLNREVTGDDFRWDAPEEGVYHWRLTRPGKKGGGEGSTFVSGSFVAVDGGVERARPAAMSWQAVPGADRYKLYLVDPDGHTRTMLSQATTFSIPSSAVPLMIELVPYSGTQRTFRDYHFQPSLKFDAGAPKGAKAVAAATPPAHAATAAAAAAGAVAGNVAGYVSRSPGAVGAGAKPGKPLAAAPVVPKNAAPATAPKPANEPKDITDALASAQLTTPPPSPSLTDAPPSPTIDASKPAAAPKPAAKPEPKPDVITPPPAIVTAAKPDDGGWRRRRHLVYGMFFYEEDKLRFQQLDLDLKSREGLTGVGAGFWLNPISGLIVAGQGMYHEHKGILVDEARYPGQKIFLDQSRYSAQVDLGFNLLSPFGIDDHLFSLALTGAAAQLPGVEAIPDQLPTFEKSAHNMIGGTVAYGYLSEGFAVVLDGTMARASEKDAEFAQGRLVLDIYPTDRVVLQLGGFARRTAMTRCNSEPLSCLQYGKAHTESREAGGYVGVGGVFM